MLFVAIVLFLVRNLKRNISLIIFFQNPLYMKDKFRLVIESLHVPDAGHQDNVSLIPPVFFLFVLGGAHWWCWIISLFRYFYNVYK